MKTTQYSQQPDIQSTLNRNGLMMATLLSITGGISTILFLYLAYSNQETKIYLVAGVAGVATAFFIYGLILTQRLRTNFAVVSITIGVIFSTVAVVYLVQGIGVYIALIAALILIAFVALMLTQNYSLLGVGAAFAVGAGLFLFDARLTQAGVERVDLPQLQNIIVYIVVGIGISVLLLFVSQFNRFSLQNKITLGILITGVLIVATITFFGIARTQSILASISEKYEARVTSETETQILNRVQTEGNSVNAVFAEIINKAINIAQYRADLESQKNSFTNGSYWNSVERIFQLPNGQIGNSNTDVASVFIPSTVPVTEEMLVDLNASIYLDFLAPALLQTHQEVVAVYFISSTGYTVYYPNTNLASNVPNDFDPRSEDFYTIATPEKNIDRLPRWTNPYLDPAGAGGIVTLSIPVYAENEKFIGVIGVDVQLNKILELISGIQLSESDFAFLVDQNGFIIAMPEKGFQVFGIEQREISSNPLERQSIFDTQSQILQFAAQRIVINETNLLDFPINGIQTYLAVANLPSTNYKLVIFAPTIELNAEILASRQEVQNEVEESLRSAGFILIGLFIGALVISLFVGQIITRPIKRLTNAVEEISGGNLTARAEINSQDEAGVLARSFNAMAQTLSETLSGLEERIAERTLEIEKISENNAKRAAQFESIARVSHVISSTQTIDRLLPQIVQTISEEFNFYHVGIFLLDIHKEFAILAASNSEGGKRMLERSHRLRVGETGIVGYVTRSGQPRVALDVGADAVFFNNPDLPETRSEIALPLRIGVDIFGALDVQSVETNAFSEEDVNILSVLADQVSIAIQNARSHQQSREALEQAELSTAQMIEQQWSQFLGKQNVTQYHFDGVEASQASRGNEKQSQNLAIPLILRGAKIGTLKLSTADPNRVWDEDEIAIAQATAERTALAIENARLLLEAQKRATKERTIGEVSAKIGNSISLESILKTTIQELGNTLPGAEIAIQFSPDSSEQK